MHLATVQVRECVCVLSCSVVSNLATSWTVACQAPLSMGFPRQEYWSGLSFPPPGDLPDPGIEPSSPVVSCTGRWTLPLYHWEASGGEILKRQVRTWYQIGYNE